VGLGAPDNVFNISMGMKDNAWMPLFACTPEIKEDTWVESHVEDLKNEPLPRQDHAMVRALSVTQRDLSVTQRALSATQRALSVTQRALSVTQRALSVTQRALSVTQRALSVTPASS
jgi:hypothetical protein